MRQPPLKVTARDVATWALLAGAYVVVAKLGLRFASITSSVTLVWPSSGLALAALLVLGRGAWPGVALGALVVNASTPGVGLPVAAGIAAGNTLEAVLGAWLLRRAEFMPSLARIGDVLRLAVLGALASTMVSATFGVASLSCGGILAASDRESAWRAWWLGDLMGDLVFAPLLLSVAAAARSKLARARAVELLALGGVITATTLFVFDVLPKPGSFPQSYVLFPLLAWAALRFGMLGAAACNLVVSMISVVATANGHGPFVLSTLNDSLAALQTFMAVTVIASLILAAAVAERDRAIALRDEFLALATHELNTPLASLQLGLGSLRRMLGRGDVPAEKLQHRADHTQQQLDRMQALVARLLDSSQIAAGNLMLTPEAADLVAVVRAASAPYDAELRARDRALEIDAPSAIEGAWDRPRLELVVGNLLSNAVKYGGDQPITVRLTSAERSVTIEVRDGGIGIAPEHKERIFERFERGVSAKNYPGFGLGLWITRAIVQAMGGRIDVTSELGAGATFTVTLPRAPPQGNASWRGSDTFRR